MSSYYTPKIKRGLTTQIQTRDGSTKLYSSNIRVNNLRKTFNQLIDQVKEKKDISERAVTQVYQTNQELKNQLQNQQNDEYIDKLEHDNIQMKKRLNDQIKRNIELMKRIGLMEQEQYESKKNASTNGSNKDLQLQNKALKARLLKLNEDYNKLYYQLEVIKESNQKLRKQTVTLLSRKQRI